MFVGVAQAMIEGAHEVTKEEKQLRDEVRSTKDEATAAAAMAGDGAGLLERTTARDWTSPRPPMEGMGALGRALAV